MVFSQEDKAVIRYNFLEKSWSVYQICKEHPTKKWNKVSLQILLKCFHEHGSMDRRPGSERPQTAMTEENKAMTEDLICLQEEKLYVTKGNRKTYQHQLVICEENSEEKRIKTIQVSEDTSEG